MSASRHVARAGLRVALHVLQVGHRYLYAVAATVALVMAFQAAELLIRFGQFRLDAAPTVGDIVAFALAGSVMPDSSELLIAPLRALELPFGWIILAITPPILTALLVPSGARYVVVEAAGSHEASLLGQCLSAVAGCLMCWTCVFVSSVVMTVLLGGFVSLDVSPWLASVIGVAPERVAHPPYEIAPALTALVTVSCGLSVAQVGLASACGERVGLLAALIPIVAAPFAATPALLGNLMMLARSTVFVAVSLDVGSGASTSFSPCVGLFAAISLVAIGVLAGGSSLLRAKR